MNVLLVGTRVDGSRFGLVIEDASWATVRSIAEAVEAGALAPIEWESRTLDRGDRAATLDVAPVVVPA